MNSILKLNGYPINQAIKTLKKVKFNSHEEALAYQEEMKWSIFQHHCENNTHYINFIKQKVITNWLDIPILRKTDIQAPLSDRISKGYSAKNSHVHNTSGSTGTPFYFAKDKFCHALSWALIYNRFNWHGIKNGNDLQARFYGMSKKFTKRIKEKLKDFFSSRIRFSVFDLSDYVLASYLNTFKKKPFVYVNGYTSSLVMMAKYCLANNTTVKKVCPSLKLVFTTSEVCDDIDRKTLERGFGVPVINEYGAAELDLIGFEDADGDWLVNYETLFVEILDDNDKPVLPGEEGKVVITSLYNKAMPFIRYEIGDRAILKKDMKGAYQILESVKGRTNDIAILPSGKRAAGLTFYYISKQLLENGGFMKEFVIRQKTTSHFHYEYVANREISEIEKKQIFQAMDAYLEKGLFITFEKKNIIERSNAGKFKHFFSEIKLS
jgi:phenylacetate-CoA ligase